MFCFELSSGVMKPTLYFSVEVKKWDRLQVKPELSEDARETKVFGISCGQAGFGLPIPTLFHSVRGEDAMETGNGNSKLNGTLLFAVGGLIGAGLALLFAPQSGRRTRRDIVHLGKMAKKKSDQIQLQLHHAIDNLVGDISEKMQEGVDRGREWTESTTQGILHALNSGKDYIRKELDTVISRRA